MAKVSEPRCIEVSVTRSQGGKISIVKYDHSSDWFNSMGRRYEMPEDWTQDQIDEFHIEKQAELEAIIDALDQADYDVRAEQSSVIG
jgi:hypothetical protein